MARKATPLTTTQIKAAKPAEKEYTLQDGGGLFLVIKPSGSKLWRFNYYRPSNKKRTIISLGSLDEVSTADARKRRSEYRTLIAAGTDPQEYERQKLEAEARRQGNTFENVACVVRNEKKPESRPQYDQGHLALAREICIPVYRKHTDRYSHRSPLC